MEYIINSIAAGFSEYEERLIFMTRQHEDQVPPKDLIIMHGVTDDLETLKSKAWEIIDAKGKCTDILVKPSCTNNPESPDFLITLTFDYPGHYEKVSYLTNRTYMAITFAILNQLRKDLLTK